MRRLALCLNWKVLAGLGAVALGIGVVAPKALAAVFPVLLAAACPLSMLLMMRGMSGSRCATPQDGPDRRAHEAERPGQLTLENQQLEAERAEPARNASQSASLQRGDA